MGTVTVLDAALELADRGWPVFPCKGRGKQPITRNGCLDATTDRDRISCWPNWETSNIGLATGGGLVVLDVDGDAGAESLRALERTHGELPRTVSVVTGGGGAHYYFATDVDVRNSAGQLGDGLDVRGAGGYVIAPPSLHKSGRRYAWDDDPSEVELATAPAWLVESAAPTTLAAAPPEQWLRLVNGGLVDGKRNTETTRLVGHLMARYVDPRLVLDLALAVNAHRCRPPLPPADVEKIVNSVAGRELRKREARAA